MMQRGETKTSKTISTKITRKKTKNCEESDRGISKHLATTDGYDRRRVGRWAQYADRCTQLVFELTNRREARYHKTGFQLKKMASRREKAALLALYILMKKH